jgi:hypothetical protein
LLLGWDLLGFVGIWSFGLPTTLHSTHIQHDATESSPTSTTATTAASVVQAEEVFDIVDGVELITADNSAPYATAVKAGNTSTEKGKGLFRCESILRDALAFLPSWFCVFFIIMSMVSSFTK